MKIWIKEFSATMAAGGIISSAVVFLYSQFTPQSQMDLQIGSIKSEIKDVKDSILNEMTIRREARNHEMDEIRETVKTGNESILRRIDRMEDGFRAGPARKVTEKTFQHDRDGG